MRDAFHELVEQREVGPCREDRRRTGQDRDELDAAEAGQQRRL